MEKKCSNKDIFENWTPNLASVGCLVILLLLMESNMSYYFLLTLAVLCVVSIILFYLFKLPPPSSTPNAKSFLSSKIYGHRGCVSVENIDQGTLKAFQYAYDSGANGIECDIRLTKDRVPIIVHDYHIRNITYYNVFDNISSFNFHQLTLKEIQGLSLKYKAKFLTLTELVDFMNEHKYINTKQNKEKQNKCEYFNLLLEFKHCIDGYSNKDLQNIMSIVNNIQCRNNRVIFVSFSVSTIYRLRRMYNDINIGLIFERHMWWNWIQRDIQIVNYKHYTLHRFVDPIHTFFCQWILPYFCGCVCVGVDYKLLSEFSIHHYQQNGIYTFCWGPKSKIDIQWLLSKGVCVVADDPLYALKCASDIDQPLKI